MESNVSEGLWRLESSVCGLKSSSILTACLQNKSTHSLFSLSLRGYSNRKIANVEADFLKRIKPLIIAVKQSLFPL